MTPEEIKDLALLQRDLIRVFVLRLGGSVEVSKEEFIKSFDYHLDIIGPKNTDDPTYFRAWPSRPESISEELKNQFSEM